jgi:hypothetical protein
MRADPQQNTAIFAHLTRRMSAFNALFEFGDSLLAYLGQHRWATREMRGTTITTTTISDHLGWAYWNQPWLWHKPDSLRLALKTCVGMALASLFVAVPFLWRIASPFGIWPGVRSTKRFMGKLFRFDLFTHPVGLTETADNCEY